MIGYKSPGDSLQLNGVSKAYPGVQALDRVSLEINSGQVTGLTGENGAGKSSLIKIMAGITAPTAGSVSLNGRTLTLKSPREALANGVSVVFQELSLVPAVSVAENIYFGDLPARGPVMDWKSAVAGAREWCDRVGLDVSPRAPVSKLSVAQRQLVEIAKSLARRPRIIALDEPTSALGSAEIEHLKDIVRGLRDDGVGILFVSHKMEELFELTDSIVILRDGCVVENKPTSSLTEDEVIRKMVGRDVSAFYSRKVISVKRDTEPLLAAEGLTTSHVRDISFEVRPGEVLGFGGLMGAGRTEVARAVFGLDRLTGGSLCIQGKRRNRVRPWEAVKLGVGYVPEERKEDGLVLSAPIRENVSLASLNRFATWGIIRPGRERKAVRESVKKLRVKSSGIEQPVGALSGGNQQKAVLARWLIDSGLKVLILDEPTRGIDVNAKSEIYEMIEELTEEGLAVILMSSELPELISLSDRVCVMAHGTIVATLERTELSEESIVSHAMERVSA